MSLEDLGKHKLTLEQIEKVLEEFEPGKELRKFRNTAIYHSFKFNYNTLKNQQSSNSPN